MKYGLGILEHLLNYRPDTSALTVVVLPVDEPDKFSQTEHKDLAHLIVLTDLRAIP